MHRCYCELLKRKILIIVHEKNLARFVALALCHVRTATVLHFNGRLGLVPALAVHWDAILLDLMLPEQHGLVLCRRVRQVCKLPIIKQPARASELARVSGLDHGAEAYIVCPFAIAELLARYCAYYCRISIAGENNTACQTTICYRDLVIECENRVVRRGEAIIE